MSRADYVLLNNYMTILKDGEWDTDQNVRPKWADGKPAHTVKKFGVVNRYDLNEEFPISGVRKTNWKASIDEIVWIWVLKSNNVKDLNSKIWDQWANKGERPNQEIGSIGKAYGYQLGEKKILTKDGKLIDQVDSVLHELKHNPANRRILTEIYNHGELHEMNLAPCVHEATFNVTNGVLNMVLNQRSNDTLAAGSWNVVQYATLLKMMAQVSGLKAGEMVHVVTDSHTYDKHVPMELEIIFNRCSLIQKILFRNNIFAIMDKIENRSTIQNLKELIKDMYDVDFDRQSAIARVAQNQDINYQDYLKSIRSSKPFKVANSLIQRMLMTPELDKVLGFSTPKLVLDPNVKDFYDFKSPKIRTGKDIYVENGLLVREGKFADNPESSFDVVDYFPEREGKELATRVPVAE